MRGEEKLDMKDHVTDKILILPPFPKPPSVEGVFYLFILNIIVIFGGDVSI